jgi:DnaJ-class molecular chaperone
MTIKCPTCRGSGVNQDGERNRVTGFLRPCDKCKGVGKIWRDKEGDDGE